MSWHASQKRLRLAWPSQAKRLFLLARQRDECHQPRDAGTKKKKHVEKKRNSILEAPTVTLLGGSPFGHEGNVEWRAFHGIMGN